MGEIPTQKAICFSQKFIFLDKIRSLVTGGVATLAVNDRL